MRHDDEGTAVAQNFLEGGEGAADAGVIGDVAVVVEGHVEVNADDGFFAFEIVVVDVSHFGECLCCFGKKLAWVVF